MGIYSRDYIREERPSGGFYGSHTGSLWAIKFLLIANILVFLVQNAVPQSTEWLALNLGKLFNADDPAAGFQLWRVITYGFCHSTQNLMHIAFNMFVLWMFGRTIEPILGSREFLAMYLGGVIASGLCHVGMQAATGNQAGVVGASGGVMTVVFCTAMIFPRMTVLLMFVIPVELRYLAVIYAVVDVFGVFSHGSNVAHVAHLGGAAFGVAYRYYNWRLSGMFDGVSRWWRTRGQRRTARRSKLKVYNPPKQENIDERVDAILDKINREGEASLTEEERTLLSEASRRYRERQ